MNDVTRDDNMDIRQMVNQRRQEIETPENASYHHGDYIPGNDGEAGGFLIDTEEEIREKTHAPEIDDIKKYISDQNAAIDALKTGKTISDDNVAANRIDANQNRDAQSVERSGARDRPDLLKVHNAFKDMELTANGLAPSGSADAEAYARKMRDLEEGKANLNDYVNPPVRNSASQDIQSEVVQPDEVIDPTEGVVQFNVDSNNTQEFISTLNKVDRAKIQHSTTIVVNEIKTIDVPTATRTISSMDEYKRIAPRVVSQDYVECVLPNSGFVATVKGCGALAMATLLPDNMENSIDLNKRYQFCYDNLVTTSIGKLSYQEFISNTSTLDIPILLFNIFKASEPEEQEITLVCGAENCGSEYNAKYKISDLLDVEDINEDTMKQIDKVVNVRDIVVDAKAVHEESPVMARKYIQVKVGEKTIVFELKSPDGTTVVERNNLIKDLAKSYSRFVIGLLMYVPKIYITFQLKHEKKPATYEVTDPFVIAENLGDLKNDAVQVLSKVVGDLVEYPETTYSFKGSYKCPHCGRLNSKIPCSVDSLIFFRVQKAMQQGSDV